MSVEAGKNRPYYLKAKGKENGTYIRVAGTSRQAFPEKIRELEMEGARISWDELTCVGYSVSEEETEKLCRDIESFRKKAGMAEHSVKSEQLIGLLEPKVQEFDNMYGSIFRWSKLFFYSQISFDISP